MAFRNPVHSLPASAITGQLGPDQIANGAVTGTKLSADAIDGKTVTGATVQSASNGHRIVLGSDGVLRFVTGLWPETSGGRIEPDTSNPVLNVYGPTASGVADYGLRLQAGTTKGTATLLADTVNITSPNTSISGLLSAGSLAFGKVDITPVANTPTSVTVTNLNVAGSSFIALVTANSTVPGTSVLGVSASSVSGTSVTVWLDRAGTTTTTVYWAVIGL